MISIKTSKLKIERDLKNKIEIIFSFNNIKPKFINGSIRNIGKTKYFYNQRILSGIFLIVKIPLFYKNIKMGYYKSL